MGLIFVSLVGIVSKAACGSPLSPLLLPPPLPPSTLLPVRPLLVPSLGSRPRPQMGGPGASGRFRGAGGVRDCIGALVRRLGALLEASWAVLERYPGPSSGDLRGPPAPRNGLVGSPQQAR